MVIAVRPARTMSKSLAPVNARCRDSASGGASVVVEASAGGSVKDVAVEPEAADADWLLTSRGAVVVVVEGLVVDVVAVDEVVATVVAVVVGGT
jgi:hypothetical protein